MLRTAVFVFVPHLIFITNFTVSHLHHAEQSFAVIAKAMFCSAGYINLISGSDLSNLIGHLHLASIGEHYPQFIEVLMRLQASGLADFHLHNPNRTRLISCILAVQSPGTFYNAWAIHNPFPIFDFQFLDLRILILIQQSTISNRQFMSQVLKIPSLYSVL
jgi:hypothetical protein